jgi:hypothetical protein
MTPVGSVRCRPPSCAGSLATAVYGRFDIGRRNFRWASAGHLPPLAVATDGQQILRRLTDNTFYMRGSRPQDRSATTSVPAAAIAEGHRKGRP